MPRIVMVGFVIVLMIIGTFKEPFSIEALIWLLITVAAQISCQLDTLIEKQG